MIQYLLDHFGVFNAGDYFSVTGTWKPPVRELLIHPVSDTHDREKFVWAVLAGPRRHVQMASIEPIDFGSLLS